jgi:hypothetical protein
MKQELEKEKDFLGKNPLKLRIKFEKDYPKLQGLTQVKLIQVIIKQFEELEEVFLNYDAKQSDGLYYQFKFKPKDLVLFLVFADYNSYKMFTTVRRYTPNKYAYYKMNVGKQFEIVRGNKL